MKYLKAFVLTIFLGTVFTGCYTEFANITKDRYAEQDTYENDRGYDEGYKSRYNNSIIYNRYGYDTYRYSYNGFYDPFFNGYLYRSSFFSPYLCNYCHRTSLINHRLGLLGFGFTPLHFGGAGGNTVDNRISGPRGSGIFRSSSRTKPDLRRTERDRRTRSVRSVGSSSTRSKVKTKRSLSRSSGQGRVTRSKSRSRSSGSRVRSKSSRSKSGSNSGRTRSSGRDRNNN